MVENIEVLVVASELYPARRISRLMIHSANVGKLGPGILREKLDWTLQDHPFDVVVAGCDSREDGIKLLGMVRRQRAETPVILVSEEISEADVIALLNAGAFDVVAQGSVSAIGHLIDRAVSLARSVPPTRQCLTNQRESNFLQTLIASAFDAILTINERQEIVLFNASAEKMFGVKAKEINGKHLSILIPARFQAEHVKHVERFGKQDSCARPMGRSAVIFGRRSNGDEFPVEVSISKVQSAGTVFYAAILRDKSPEDLQSTVPRIGYP